MSATFTYTDLTHGLQTFACNDIVRFQAMGDYTHMHLAHAEKPHLISKRLGEIMAQLANEINFVRVGRTHLVNRHYMQRITKGRRPMLILSKGLPVPVPRERAAKVRALVRQKHSA